MNNVQIAIIGAGPAGISCALQLSKYGYDDIVIFEREDEAGGTPRHCGHLGFGMFEFFRVLSGPAYAKKLVNLAKENNIQINTNHTLIDIKDNVLKFSTPNGLKEYTANRTVLALGARETPRASRLTSGSRSPNILTTGALQRFVYMQEYKPFENAVIIGSEVVSFSALMTAKHAGINIKAIIEEDKNLNSFSILKYLSQYILGVPVKINYTIEDITTNNKDVKSIVIKKGDKIETIACDAVIFTGKFTPQSALLQKSFADFNHTNNSIFVSQTFQTQNKNFFAAGNIIRGALSAFNCYFEGKKVANSVDKSLYETNNPSFIKITADENIQWYSPSLIDINQSSKSLTTLRLNKKVKGFIRVNVNDKEIFKIAVNANTYNNIKIPSLEQYLQSSDKIHITFSKYKTKK